MTTSETSDWSVIFVVPTAGVLWDKEAHRAVPTSLGQQRLRHVYDSFDYYITHSGLGDRAPNVVLVGGAVPGPDEAEQYLAWCSGRYCPFDQYSSQHWQSCGGEGCTVRDMVRLAERLRNRGFDPARTEIRLVCSADQTWLAKRALATLGFKFAGTKMGYFEAQSYGLLMRWALYAASLWDPTWSGRLTASLRWLAHWRDAHRRERIARARDASP